MSFMLIDKQNIIKYISFNRKKKAQNKATYLSGNENNMT